MRKLRAVVKAFLCLCIIFGVLLFSTITIYPFYKFKPFKYRKVLGKFSTFGIKLLGYTLGLKVNIKGLDKIPLNQSFLSVCNHMSYLDILALGTCLDLSYITSNEMREALGLGQVVELSGCVFVERRKDKRGESQRNLELEDIKKSMQRNVNVGLFPEATSTNGDKILKFKKAMYYPAFELGIPVLVSCLNYKKIDGQKVDLSNRDLICWYDDMGFGEHIWKTLQAKVIEVDLDILKLIETKNAENIAAIVEESYQLISSAYNGWEDREV